MLEPIIEDKLHKAIKSKSASYLKSIIKRDDFKKFKAGLSIYLQTIDLNESEENFKIHLADFFKKIFPDNLIETQERIDLIIRKGKTKTDNAVVLFEAKRSDNKSDMITPDNLNKKAFHEMILYFMRERANGNTDIKHLIINTQTEFFIFNARDFEDLFYNNTQFKKDFTEFNNGEKTDSKTEFFYKQIAKNYLENSVAKIPVTYFDLNDYKEFLSQPDDKTAEKKLEHLYKIFSPEFLFNKPLKNDNNSLNKEFYNELLYIMGLHETKENNKYVIQRLPEKDRNPASLIENTILKIQSKNKFSDANMINQYGLNVTERAFNIALELCLVWINRLLFLKLLEAQIVSIHKNNPDYLFLNCNKVSDYDDLSDLFFEILAKKAPERHKHLQEKFHYIPYLNSSLFEISDMEDAFSISMLNNADMPVYKNTVLKNNNKPLYQELKTLDYIFKFLDAYNFSSDNDDTIQEAPKTIINASVLGLIFEKINGYKDGSIFTPSYITMYMSRQVIEQAVIHKFKEKYKWNIETMEGLKNKLQDNRNPDDIKEQNKVFNSLKICDPAVGSGHFLVSCLNEMIYIKSYLGILADKDGKRIAECDISLENDEIIILNDITNEPYCYTVHSKGVTPKIQHIQQTFFHEKKTLIENCLFGVDINQNSVNICRLRLWIELLKNAYYTSDSNFTELETLPNIDINIKCGNALLSEFGLTDSLSLAFKNKGLTVRQYRNMVNTYKNTKDKAIKRDLETRILDIKNHFRKEHISTIDREINRVERQIIGLEAQTEMSFGQDKFMDRHRELTIRALKGEIQKLIKTKHAYETDLTFMNALEWRFEFPEVLDDDGNFIGFDIVIGNPPYIKEYDNKSAFDNLRKSPYYQGKMDIWYFFGAIGLDLLKPNGIQSFIAPNNWITNAGASKFRNTILQFSNFTDFIDFGNFMVFDNASIQTMIYKLIKTKDVKQHTINYSYLKNDKATPLIVQNFFDKNIDPKIKANNYDFFSVTINTEQSLDKLITFNKKNVDAILDKLLQQDNINFLKFNEIGQGIVLPQDFVIKNHLNILPNLEIEEGIFNLTDIQKQKLNWQENEIQKIKPFYTSKELQRYYSDTQLNDLWVLYLGSDTNKNISEYPNIQKHLDKFTKIITSDNKPYGLHRARKEDFFVGEKIVSLRKCSDKPIFTYTDFDCYVSQSYFIIKTNRLNLKYLTGVLNSKLITFWLRYKGKMQGNNYQIDKVPLMQLPIKTDIKYENKIIDLVDKIIEIKKTDPTQSISSLESQIDTLVYALYGLTDDEIRVIEGDL